MLRTTRKKTNKYKLEIFSRDKKKVELLIEKSKGLFKPVISYEEGRYKCIGYGELDDRKQQALNPYYVDDSIWAYEYHEQVLYVYHNYMYKDFMMAHIEKVVDILYRTGPVSTEEAFHILV